MARITKRDAKNLINGPVLDLALGGCSVRLHAVLEVWQVDS
jgi:hypothetical protein